MSENEWGDFKNMSVADGWSKWGLVLIFLAAYFLAEASEFIRWKDFHFLLACSDNYNLNFKL